MILAAVITADAAVVYRQAVAKIKRAVNAALLIYPIEVFSAHEHGARSSQTITLP